MLLLWGSAYSRDQIGFAGAMAVNLMGAGFIVIAALMLSAASIYGKRLSQQTDAMVMTGYQLAIGPFSQAVAAAHGGKLWWASASIGLPPTFLQ